ncbi:MAG: rhomboid family intramembrane serine protease [Verrucomicrobiales bacterium]
MIPLRDENPTRSFAFVTLTLIVINVLVFLREITLVDVRVFFEQYALLPQRVSQAGSPKDYLPVLTSMFLHGGWMHLILNMWFFWLFVRLFNVLAILMLAVWFGLQLVSGWLTKSDQGGGVAFWAHIGAFIAGLVLIPLFKKRRVRLFQ